MSNRFESRSPFGPADDRPTVDELGFQSDNASSYWEQGYKTGYEAAQGFAGLPSDELHAARVQGAVAGFLAGLVLACGIVALAAFASL